MGDGGHAGRPRRRVVGGRACGAASAANRPAVEILEAALATTVRDGDQPSTHVVGVTMTEPDVRRALESAYRSAARLSDDLDERIELVDRASTVRLRSLT